MRIHQWVSRSLAAMLDNQMAAFAAVRKALPALARAADAAAARLGQGGRLVYAGAGASGPVAGHVGGVDEADRQP